MKICSARLTTCGILQDGHSLHLDLVDDKGADVSLELPFDQAQAVAMTLPSLLTRALQVVTGKTSSRYVFPLDNWTVEQSNDCNGLLLTLATADGFQVSFGIPAEVCKGLGVLLATGSPARTDGSDDELETPSLIVLN